jgi:uncharacterized paraquat-inducible protein A
VARSYQCWDCGRTVGAEEIERYEVTRTSTSGGRGGGRIYAHSKRVNLCRDCLAKHERRNRWKLLAYAVVIAAIILYFVLR